MELSERYTWEAERADGTIITEGGDLAGCVRFSLIPAEKVYLPRHDIIGVPMERRFCRGFIKTHFNQREELPGRVFWKSGSCRLETTDDLREFLQPGDLIGKGVAGEKWYPVVAVHSDRVVLLKPFDGTGKPKGMFARRIRTPGKKQRKKYLHCVVCRDIRVWIDYLTGAALITEKGREIYL